jgi:hypothetical protein
MVFKSDLIFGNKYEQEFVNYLGYDNFKIIEGHFKEYDIEIVIDNVIIYFEIKADRLTHKTNNICIEYECNNKPSGITTTKANHYGYFEIINDNEYRLYVIPVNIIKKNINKKLYNRCINGGDGYRSKFYLFNKDIYSKYII